jgi:hypothetical protein
MTGAGSVLAGLGIALATTVVPIWAFLALLNARDRRRDALTELVYCQFPSEWGRSELAVTARAGLLSGHGSVRVDLGSCSREEAWAALARLRARLPGRIRLIVRGQLGARPEAARLTVEALPALDLGRAA